MTCEQAAVVPPPDFGSGRGVRARIREYRLGLVRQVLHGATKPLRYEDVCERVQGLDGQGIPLRTLKEPPFCLLIAAQVRRPGRPTELTGLPWRYTRLDDDRIAARVPRAEARLIAMGVGHDQIAPPSDYADDRRGRLERLWDLERAIEALSEERGRAIAAGMKALLVRRRAEVAEIRERALSQAYHELRQPVRSALNGQCAAPRFHR